MVHWLRKTRHTVPFKTEFHSRRTNEIKSMSSELLLADTNLHLRRFQAFLQRLVIKCLGSNTTLVSVEIAPHFPVSPTIMTIEHVDFEANIIRHAGTHLK